MRACVSLLCVAALLASLAAAAAASCGVAEFSCRNARCIRLDRYCDGVDDCGDSSDEPPHCSVCNRTYYGEVGVAYSLSAGGPGEAAPRVPFLCHLTFTAGGGARGALVQLWLDEFRVGRYEAGAPEPCPDGYVQLAELGRPFTGGSWCGEAAGPAVYYSETATVTVSVKLFRARLGETFALRMRYKFLAQHDAVVRFGEAAAPLERGAVSPGTYCTRTYEECHRKPCRLQSPNYPGMYPRNVTCYWSLRQKDIPTCKHAMISIRQEFAHKMQIKRSISMASMNKTRRVVRAWASCVGAGDRLLVYDGASTDDPLLLEYCGGDWLPRVTARGPEMLVAFHSSPVAAPPRPAARGFELDVDVVFADADSLEYAREPRRCEFHLKASSSEDEAGAGGGGGGEARRGRRGVLRAPQHTLPPNTTCSWTFHGRPGDLVWLYFSSYSHYSLVDLKKEESKDDVLMIVPAVVGSTPASPWARLREMLRATPPPPRPPMPPPAPRSCPVALRIWDGGGEGEPGAELLGRYCAAPVLCARASLANATRAPRPCSPPDGYVSKGAMMSLSVTSTPGTATHPLSFALHYEFIDAQMPGTPLPDAEHRIPAIEPRECARLIDKEGNVTSPRNVLWFGRGGARRLRCVWRVDAGAGRVALRVLTAQFGVTPRCTTRPDAHTGRPSCVADAADHHDREYLDYDATPEEDVDADHDADMKHPHLMIYEAPWPGIRVPLACICDNSSGPVSVVSGAHALELELVAALRPDEDQRHVRFSARWSRGAAPQHCAQRRRLQPPGGHVSLHYPYEGSYESECGEAPFFLQARGNRSVFLRIWGEEIPLVPKTSSDPPECPTLNRVLVYEASSGVLVRVVCPGATSDDAPTVQVFSGQWWGRGDSQALLVRWSGREVGSAAFAWMEVWRSPAELAARLRPAELTMPPGNGSEGECWRACPELSACMDPALWCDGWADCPRGGDEAGGCGAGARLLAALGAWGGAGVGAAAGGAAAAAALLLLLCWRRRRGKSRPPRALTEDLLCDAASRAASLAASRASSVAS